MKSIESLINKKSLINDTFSKVPAKPFYPKSLVSYVAKSKNLKFLGCEIDEIVCGATNISESICIASTMAEFIERFLGAYVDTSKLIYGSYIGLIRSGLNCLNPKTIQTFANWQYKNPDFPFKTFSAKDETYWIEGFDYLNKRKIYIPIFLVYWVDYKKESTKYLIPTTTGLAAGDNLNNAIVSGFLEAAERHFYCKIWYEQKKAEFITYSSNVILNTYSDERIKTLFTNKDVHIKVFDLGKNAFVETILVMMFYTYKNKKYYSTGAASRFNKKEAIIKACTEAYQIMSYITEVKNQFDFGTLNYKEALPTLNNFEKQFSFYNFYPEKQKYSPIFREALRKDATKTKIVEFKDKLSSLAISEIKHKTAINNLFYVDLSNDNLTGLSFNVAKVVIPDLIPISPDFNYPYLGNNLLKNKKQLFLNLPHCFA